MKIILLAKLVKVLKNVYDNATDMFMNTAQDGILQTPSGLSYRLFCTKQSACIHMVGLSELLSFQHFSMPLDTMLRDDHKLTIQTRYNIFKDIIRESSTELYKARNSFPVLPPSRLTHDELEAIEFQLLTRYTQNEVNSMILYHLYSTEYNNTHPRCAIDFNVYDILSEEDLEHLINVVKVYYGS